MGNQSSELDRWEMIEWFMNDALKMKAIHERSPHPLTLPTDKGVRLTS